MKRTIVITAGPTREYIDPIRFISNESTGILGNAIARAARDRGHKVIVISGNKDLEVLSKVRYVYIDSARELEAALRRHLKKADVLFMTSAVCDFRPVKVARYKIKRTGNRPLVVTLRPNRDVLKAMAHSVVKRKKIYVGFCIETSHVLKNARSKLKTKNLDMIVASRYSASQSPFGNRKMSPLILKRDGTVKRIGVITKRSLAHQLVRMVEQ
ncbi:MAG: phosphopantothenoylcysteine decarboxylase [Candidatus Omnitrophica bacterium]|nr:phosphopantothenoylcysteine decarboxylase [Candidatus Omnitrophota bacterium]